MYIWEREAQEGGVYIYMNIYIHIYKYVYTGREGSRGRVCMCIYMYDGGVCVCVYR